MVGGKAMGVRTMRRSNFALRLQPSLLEEARRLAAAEGVAVNQLINVAVAEKLAVARAERRLAGGGTQAPGLLQDAAPAPAPTLALAAAPPDRDRIVRVLRAHESDIRGRGVTRLALVGSLARGEATAASDVDLLVDIAPGRKFSLIDLAGLQGFLGDVLGRETQVLIRDDLPPDFRRRVEGDAVPVL